MQRQCTSNIIQTHGSSRTVEIYIYEQSDITASIFKTGRRTYVLEPVWNHEVFRDVFWEDIGEKKFVDQPVPLHLPHLLPYLCLVEEVQTQLALYLKKSDMQMTRPGY